MAAKKTATKKSEATEKKTAAKAPKATVKKSTGDAAAKTKPAAAKAPAAKKPALKLTDKMKEALKKIHDAGEAGYVAPKTELRSLESLREKKLIKRIKVDKETGSATYGITVAGKKHATAMAAAPAPTKA